MTRPILTLDRLQAEQEAWEARNFPSSVNDSDRSLKGIMEELGELAHADLKGEQGIRHAAEEILDKKMDAAGDLVVYLASYCRKQGFSLQDAVERAWGEVKHRDWIKYPGDGRTR